MNKVCLYEYFDIRFHNYCSGSIANARTRAHGETLCKCIILFEQTTGIVFTINMDKALSGRGDVHGFLSLGNKQIYRKTEINNYHQITKIISVVVLE